MESVLGRYKNLIVLVAVLFAQILGLAVQVRRTTETESSRLIRVWAVGAVTPFEKALVWVQSSTWNVWHNYFYLRGVRAENRALKEEIQQMRLEQVRMSQDADQARRLQALLAFKEQFISKTMAAQVIGSSGSEQSRSVFIDKGEKDGLKPDMAVITADGIVGKILHVYRSTSLVLLVNDQTSGVGAILEKSRLQGILRGTASGEVGLEKVMSDESVKPGELVLTSGGDRIFPKGLPIGTISKVSPGKELFLEIRIKPSANLSKLEEVLVVTKIDERQATPEQTGPVRAADILAERLPSVPAKPAESPGAASETSPPASTSPAKTPAGTTPAGTTPSAKPPKKPGEATANTAVSSAPAKTSPGLSTQKATPEPARIPAAAAPDSRPKSSALPGGERVAPGATQPAAKASGTNAATPAVNSAGTAPKVSKPVVEPKPQPPAEDSPQ